MPVTVYKKLIRDKIPQVFAANNKIFNTRILTDDEYRVALKQKLIEESKEVLESSNKKDLIYEIADVIEVLNCIKSSENISDEDVEKCRLEKGKKRGVFSQKLFLESVEE